MTPAWVFPVAFASRSPLHRDLLKDVEYPRADILFDREQPLDLGGVHVSLFWRGPMHTRGDTLIFVDADTIVPTSTLRAALDALRSGAAGGGAEVVLDGHVPWWAEWTVAAIGGFMRACRLAAGCYIFCSRAAFDAAGGFDETLFAAEELAFSRRLARQGRVVILRESVTSSGRKIRTHGWRELFRLGATFARRGIGALRSREHLALWYDGRRDS